MAQRYNASPQKGEMEYDEDDDGKSPEKKMKRKGSKKDLPTIVLEDDEFYKKWAGPLLLGPFVPAVFSIIIIFSGQIVLNTWEGTCGYSLSSFISAAMAMCYLFLMVYSWAFLGDNIRLTIPSLGIDSKILAPFKSLKWLAGFYGCIFFMSFIVWIVGTVLLNLSIFCVKTAPVLYSYSRFLVVVYWLFFCVTLVFAIKMFFGNTIAKLVKEGTRESTLSEMEDQLFRQKFNELDLEAENKISRDDVPKLLSALGVFVPEAEQKALVETLDPEKTGQVEFRVMAEWFRKLNSELDEKNAGQGGDDDSETTGDQVNGRLFAK